MRRTHGMSHCRLHNIWVTMRQRCEKYPIQIALDNYPDIIEHGDAFAVREDDWKPPQTRSEWLDELLGGAI